MPYLDKSSSGPNGRESREFEECGRATDRYLLIVVSYSKVSCPE